MKKIILGDKIKIETIQVKNRGYVQCRSRFYSAADNFPQDPNYCFGTGVNKLYGEIDSGVWAVSYMLSMYNYRRKDFILFEQPEVIINNEVISLENFAQYSCYMDKQYPLFSTNIPVKKLVEKGIRKNKMNMSPDEVRNLFCIDSQRFERPLTEVGNEVFKAMAAIGYCYGKQVYCFPWLSNLRFEYYHRNMTGLLEILASLNQIAIVPIGEATKKA